MANILQVCQVVSAIMLTVVILLQHRGTGLGGAFGGQDMSYRSRRGIEVLLFRATIVFATTFLTSTIALLLI